MANYWSSRHPLAKISLATVIPGGVTCAGRYKFTIKLVCEIIIRLNLIELLIRLYI